jgi:ABC-type glucose/galactose transport system permease subunit
VSTEPQDLRKEIEDLKVTQAAQAAAQAGQMATMGAMQAGTVGAMVAGGVSLVVGMLMGIIIARAGQRRLL